MGQIIRFKVFRNGEGKFYRIKLIYYFLVSKLRKYYMYFWALYLISCFYISFYLSKLAPKRKQIPFLIVLFILLSTPSTLDPESTNLAPSLFVFSYDILLEQKFSTRSLKPLLLSISSSCLLLVIISFVKKRFF